MNRLVPAAFVLIGLAACDGAPLGTAPSDRSPPGTGQDTAARIGPGVAEAIAAGDVARVVIALHPPTVIGGHGAAVDQARLVRGVTEVVDGLLARVGAEDLRVVRRFAAVPALAGTVASQAALSRLAADEAVVRVDLDVGGGGGLSSSVAQIGATSRHAEGNDGAGVTVAILDTGVDTGHPALSGRIVHEACFGMGAGGAGFCPGGGTRQTGPGAAMDDAGHGTHVVGIMAGSDAAGAAGVAPAANIVAIKVMDDCSFAGCFYAFSEIVAALDYLIENQETLNVRAINMSLGTGGLFTGACDETTAFNLAAAHAVSTLRSLGAVAVASSMNNGSATQMASPACLSEVVAVGAVTSADVVPEFSNANLETDLVAPGVTITSLAVGGGTRIASGTSMAAPHASGCAALFAQTQPRLSASGLATRLRTSPVVVTDSKNGLPYPRLDCVADPAPPEPEPGPPDPETTTRVERPGSSTARNRFESRLHIQGIRQQR